MEGLPLVEKGRIILLERPAVDLARDLAKQRHDKNRSGKIIDQRYSRGTATGLDIDLQGLLGEIAFGQLFNCPQNFRNTTCRSLASETEFDTLLLHKFPVDIKTTVAVGNGLLISHRKVQNLPDLYALMYLLPERPRDRGGRLLQFQGFFVAYNLLQADLRERYLTFKFGGGMPAYYIPPADLKAFHDIPLQRDLDDNPLVLPPSPLS